MARYHLKYMFDWGSGVCIWASNEAALQLFGSYPIECEKLPISNPLMAELNRLIDVHDKALDWNNPTDGLLWNDRQRALFRSEARMAYQNLSNELGPDYRIETHDSWMI